VDNEIAKYFTHIYKRPDYKRQQPSKINFNVDGEEEM
jgi:ribosomal protein S17E